MVKAGEDFPALMEQMGAMTAPICASECRVPHSCCAPEYCDLAKERMIEKGVDVQGMETGHPTLPYMGENGCVVDPQYRILCTLHVCCIANAGFRPGHAEWTKKYFELRDKLDMLLAKEILSGDRFNSSS